MSNVQKWSEARVSELLDFSCGKRFGAGRAMVDMQTQGVAALCNILRKQNVAYLADEVGLGKTMQALGVATCLASTLEAARILVISPRKLVQDGWQLEAKRFGRFVRKPAAPAMTFDSHDSLRSWLPGLGSGNALQSLRHSSFTRPVFDATQPDWEMVVDGLQLPDEAKPYLLKQEPVEKSLDYNRAYAKGINAWLKAKGIIFDLVIVDEAQCLRHFDNQTNTVLSVLLKGRVNKWLFLSATPAHSSIRDIATVLNKYPEGGPRIESSHLADLTLMKKRLTDFMVRRPRSFMIGGEVVHKRAYRLDDQESLKLHCQDPLDLLSIAMVQRHLAKVMDERGGTFRNGYIASFESLEDSMQGRVPHHASIKTVDADEHTGQDTDFYAEQLYTAEERAPDEKYVSDASRAFFSKFEGSLPHPKLDRAGEDLAEQAFGDPGGVKTLVFCRRVSSVRALRERLMQHYLSGIQARCQRVWKVELDWDARLDTTKHDTQDAEPGEADNEPMVADDGLNRVRQAHAEGKWLQRFRAGFSDGNRHALMFELNWFEHLCRDAGIAPDEAAGRVPTELRAEAHNVAMGSGEKRYRVRELRYLTWRCLDGYGAQIFGFSLERLAFWREVLPNVLNIDSVFQAVLQPARHASQPDPLLFRSLWSLAEARDKGLALPDAVPGTTPEAQKEALYWRKIVATVLGQYMRLSDAAIDLYFADQNGNMDEEYIAWLTSSDKDGRRLRQLWQDWTAHHRLIFSAAIGDETSGGAAERAKKPSFDFLFHLEPVVGITGSDGGHRKRALQQFNTPGLPYVILGTDSLREGVNLHLFCDRVMHYGMPWTPGDMEQRIGRVDRFFGRIERRLNAEAQAGQMAKLHVLYPYLSDTIEAQQIKTIMYRKKQSDQVQDEIGPARSGDYQHEVELDPVLEPILPFQSTVSEPYFGVKRHLR